MSAGPARLFVALELPETARAALVRWRTGALAGLEGLRPVAREGLHVTLCFLGSHAPGEIDAIAAACRATGTSTPDGLSLGDALWLPARRPRAVAASVADPDGTLADVQADLSAVLQGGGWYVPEARPFRGHVTVARVTRGARVRPVDLRAPPSASLHGAHVTLYRSRLGPGGARYEAVAR